MTAPKTMMDLPMDTKNRECGCGGPPEFVDTPCPGCGEKGVRVKAGTVRYLLKNEHRGDAVEKIYGLCLAPQCDVAWYAQDSSHHFTTSQTDTPIWTKADAETVYACYCNEITKDMVDEAVARKGLRTMEEIVGHYRGQMQMACATKNPTGRCCEEHFNAMIAAALRSFLECNC